MNWKSEIILASKSPRRSFLLKQADIPFNVQSFDMEEIVSEPIPIRQHPEYLAIAKAKDAHAKIKSNKIILAADTSVFLSGKILNKPKDEQDAHTMLFSLSGNWHEVITGVCLLQGDKMKSFSASSMVFFDQISDEEIHWYIKTYKPFDKAGSYGIQDWIGWCKIREIKGSYSNILGLPMNQVYHELKNFEKA